MKFRNCFLIFQIFLSINNILNDLCNIGYVWPVKKFIFTRQWKCNECHLNPFNLKLPVDDKIVEILNMILAVATFLPVPRMWTHLETRSALNPDMSGSRYDLDQSYLIVLSRLTMTNSIHFLEFKSIQITWWPRDHKILTI